MLPTLRLSVVLAPILGCGPGGASSAEAGGSATSQAGDTTSSGASGRDTESASSTGIPTGSGTSMGGGEGTTATSTTTTADATSSVDDTGTSTGGAGICEDPGAPGCTACDAMGEPQRLFGLTWNYAKGEPGSGLGSEELRCIVPETGSSALIAAIPGMDWLPVGHNTYDPDAAVLYAFAFANSDNITRIFSIQTITGDLLNNPPVEPTFNWSGGIHVRSDGTLVGVTWNPGALQEELRILDPATGVATLVAAIPEIATLYQAIYAYDRLADHVFMIGGANGEAGEHLFVIDAMTGALISDPVFAAPLPWSSGIYVRADGQLIGVAIDGMKQLQRLLTIDPTTAETGVIAEIPDLGPLLLGASVYDELHNTLFVVDDQFRLVQIDATSGDVLASPKLATPPNPNANYNWSGGLHIR